MPLGIRNNGKIYIFGPPSQKVLPFMAPEVKNNEVTPQSDVYALGTINLLYIRMLI